VAFLRNNSVALNQLWRVSPVNGETKIFGYEISTRTELGIKTLSDRDCSQYLYRADGKRTVPYCSLLGDQLEGRTRHGQLRRWRVSSETDLAKVVSKLSNTAQLSYLGGETIVGSRHFSCSLRH
jgi:hypothetical protein